MRNTQMSTDVGRLAGSHHPHFKVHTLITRIHLIFIRVYIQTPFWYILTHSNVIECDVVSMIIINNTCKSVTIYLLLFICARAMMAPGCWPTNAYDVLFLEGQTQIKWYDNAYVICDVYIYVYIRPWHVDWWW